MGEPLKEEEQAQIERMDEIIREGTFYQLLEVPVDADEKAVQNSYYELSRRWHPDRFFRREMGDHGEMLEVVFATITKAYKTLSNDTKRRDYDMDLRERGLLKEPADGGTYRVRLGRKEGGGEGGEKRPRRAKVRSMHADRLRKAAKKRMREDRDDKRGKAKMHYEQALAEFEEGEFVKAASSMHLAVQYAPKSEKFKKLSEEYSERANKEQADVRLAEARAAKDYGDATKALGLYRKACEFGVKDPKAYAEAAEMEIKVGKHLRNAVKWLRVAIDKKPDSIEWRLMLADAYLKSKMKEAARKEYDEVLKRDKKNKEARRGKWKAFF